MGTSTYYRRGLVALLLVTLFASSATAQQGQVVHEVKSAFQKITVWDTDDGHRQMIFDAKLDGSDAIQSEIDKTHRDELILTYARHMIAAVPLVAKPKRILVVGLGGACIQRYLRKLQPDAIIETAELDPVVLDVAKQFFYYVEDDHQKVHIGDGRRFIEQSRDKYDLIMLDAFSATSIPYLLATQEFLKAVKDHLAEGGIVCANLWYAQSDYQDMLKTYDSVFPEWHVMRCPQSTNAILVAFPTKKNITPEKWMATAREFDTKYPTNMNLPTMIERAIEVDERASTSAKVLRDAGAPGRP